LKVTALCLQVFIATNISTNTDKIEEIFLMMSATVNLAKGPFRYVHQLAQECRQTDRQTDSISALDIRIYIL